jgi:hypothetical protein
MSVNYLVWEDISPKRITEDKIRDAMGAYTRRFGIAPDTALINPKDLTADKTGAITFVTPEHITVRALERIQRNNVWVGCEGGV